MCSWIGRNNILKMSKLSKAILDSTQPLSNYQTLCVFFTELEQIISELVWKHKRPWKVKAILTKKMKWEESTFLPSEYTTKLQSLRHHGTGTDRDIDQWNKIKSSEINLCTYGQLIFDKAGKNVQRIKVVSWTSGSEKTSQLHVKEWN